MREGPVKLIQSRKIGLKRFAPLPLIESVSRARANSIFAGRRVPMSTLIIVLPNLTVDAAREAARNWWVMTHILDYFCFKDLSRYITRAKRQFASIEDLIEHFIDDVYVKHHKLTDAQILHLVETDYSRRLLYRSLALCQESGPVRANYAPSAIKNIGLQ